MTAMDMSNICSLCGTDVREGTHRQAQLHHDGDSVLFTCIVPVKSELPRCVQFLTFDSPDPEVWYRQDVRQPHP